MLLEWKVQECTRGQLDCDCACGRRLLASSHSLVFSFAHAVYWGLYTTLAVRNGTVLTSSQWPSMAVTCLDILAACTGMLGPDLSFGTLNVGHCLRSTHSGTLVQAFHARRHPSRHLVWGLAPFVHLMHPYA